MEGFYGDLREAGAIGEGREQENQSVGLAASKVTRPRGNKAAGSDTAWPNTGLVSLARAMQSAVHDLRWGDDRLERD